MRRTTLLLGLFCLGGCGVANARHARERALGDVTACQGQYPMGRGTMAPLMQCEDAAGVAYATQVAPEDVRWFSHYARQVEQRAIEVDQGRMTMDAWKRFVTDERHALASPQDRRMNSLFAMLPAAPAT